jgi:hypothetical protein
MAITTKGVLDWILYEKSGSDHCRLIEDEPMSYDLIKNSIRKSIKYIELKTYKNYFKSSLTKTKEDIKEIKMKYRKNPKIYKE